MVKAKLLRPENDLRYQNYEKQFYYINQYQKFNNFALQSHFFLDRDLDPYQNQKERGEYIVFLPQRNLRI